jgi:uncharacterized protein (TIGR03435 family)
MHADDMDFVRKFAANGSDEAFAILVRRHVNLVYSVAFRRLGNAHEAEEVAQAVFIILARKAASLPPGTILSGWLYQTALLTSANFQRSAARRQHREQEAFMQFAEKSGPDDSWHRLGPLLEEAMSRLGRKERDAIVLRFFENRTVCEVAAALGVREAAAQKRVSRATEKLRKFFVRRGIQISTAGVLASIGTHAVQAAPVELASKIAAAAALKGAGAGSMLTLIKTTLKLMAWTKAKIAIVVGVGLLLAAGTATVTVTKIVEHQNSGNWWEIEKARLETAYSPLPQVMLAPTKFPRPQDQTSGDDNGRPFGTGTELKELIDDAYSSSAARTVLPDDARQDRYDFIADLPHGAKEAIQKEIEKQLGLVAKHETRETDVLLLTAKNPHAPGLKRAASARNSTTLVDHPGKLTCVNQRMSGMAYLLEYYFRIPVIDRTGIKGRFDMTLQWHEPDPMHHDPEAVKQALLDQLGLELVPSRESINMLVVEKAQN